jgi:hypothetical protein
MLAVSPMPCTNEEARQGEAEPNCFIDDFDFTIDDDLLDDIDFSDIFQKFDEESLPGLEVDAAEILAEYSVNQGEKTAEDYCEEKNLVTSDESCNKADENVHSINIFKDENLACQAGDAKSSSSSSIDAESKQKSGGTSKSSQGKKKAKVILSWTHG